MSLIFGYRKSDYKHRSKEQLMDRIEFLYDVIEKRDKEVNRQRMFGIIFCAAFHIVCYASIIKAM